MGSVERVCACKAGCPDNCPFKWQGCKDVCPDGCPLKSQRRC